MSIEHEDDNGYSHNMVVDEEMTPVENNAPNNIPLN